MFLNQQEQLTKYQNIVRTYRPIGELIPAYWHEGDIATNDTHLHYYRTGGSRPPLLLLHGFNEYGLTWLRVAKELERDYDIIMVDARGHGRSESISVTGYPPSAHVADLVGFIEALKLERPRIIGFSMGGETVLKLAATHPELVHAFIYEGWSDARAGTNMRTQTISEVYQAWFRGWLAWLAECRTMGHEERMLSALSNLLPTMNNFLWVEEEYVPMVEAYTLFDLDLAKISMQLWDNEYQGNPAEMIKQVQCPALIMKHPTGFPTPGVHPLFRELPSEQSSVRMVLCEHTGHVIRRAAFEHYMKMIREFLGEG
jgi:N-formylmaleamate deformylase